MKKICSILLLLLSVVLPAVADSGSASAVRYVVAATDSGKGQLTIENGTENAYVFRIYSITGQVVKVVEVKSGSETVVLPKGFYIISSELGSQKIVVR